MEHVKAIVIKFLMVAVVLEIIMAGVFGFGFGETLLMSVILTLVAYVVGDLLIFRNATAHADMADLTKGNVIATVCDLVLSFVALWLMGEAFADGNENVIAASLISAVVIAVGEWVFHSYLYKNTFNDHANRNIAE